MQITDFTFKTQPYKHQETALLYSADKPAFALFMDMGTGKSKVIIDTAAYLYSNDKIDAVVIVAPNGVHRNWVLNELPAHMPDYINYKAHYYQAGAGVKQTKSWGALFKHTGLRFFCFNVESASNKKGQAELKTCVQNGRVLFVIDESQRIKSPGAKRTQFLVRLAQHAVYRRILSGSPITQSPLDLYAQYKFLDPTITGFTTYSAFKSHFAEVEQRKCSNNRRGYFEQIIGYKNIAELEHKTAPYCYRVLKENCLDLPDKVYEKVYVELTTRQKQVYKQLLDESVAVLLDECTVDIPPELLGAPKEQLMLFFATSKVTAKNAMVKILRLQQVLCGSLPDDEGAVTTIDSNRGKVLSKLIESIRGKIIIWARFRHDIKLIVDTLHAEYGDNCTAQFHGGVGTAERMEGVKRFQEDDACRFFVANQHSGGTGLTLTAASDVIYYSNDFSAEARWQSEDRAHRIGQKHNVTYHDMICEDTVDEKILEALLTKKQIANDFNYSHAMLKHEENEQREVLKEKHAQQKPCIDFEEEAWK